eukprot:2794321-Pyramimonas_sp.AAC.1
MPGQAHDATSGQRDEDALKEILLEASPRSSPELRGRSPSPSAGVTFASRRPTAACYVHGGCYVFATLAAALGPGAQPVAIAERGVLRVCNMGTYHRVLRLCNMWTDHWVLRLCNMGTDHRVLRLCNMWTDHVVLRLCNVGTDYGVLHLCKVGTDYGVLHFRDARSRARRRGAPPGVHAERG